MDLKLWTGLCGLVLKEMVNNNFTVFRGSTKETTTATSNCAWLGIGIVRFIAFRPSIFYFLVSIRYDVSFGSKLAWPN